MDPSKHILASQSWSLTTSSSSRLPLCGQSAPIHNTFHQKTRVLPCIGGRDNFLVIRCLIRMRNDRLVTVIAQDILLCDPMQKTTGLRGSCERGRCVRSRSCPKNDQRTQYTTDDAAKMDSRPKCAVHLLLTSYDLR